MAHAYVGLGSNVGDSPANVRRAIDRLRFYGTVVAASSLYRTKPWGKTDQDDFINAVVALQTALEPEALLDGLKRVEADMGRTPSERWGPRLIDLDLLTYDNRTFESERLHLPHPQLRERAFVLVPLAEIDPQFRSWRDRLGKQELAGVARLD